MTILEEKVPSQNEIQMEFYLGVLQDVGYENRKPTTEMTIKPTNIYILKLSHLRDNHLSQISTTLKSVKLNSE